jgi:hypothetical protein
MKKLCNKIIVYIGYALAVAALLTVFANMIAISAYMFVLIAIVCGIAYYHLKDTHDNT